MGSRAEYVPGPATGARAEKGGEKWTLVLVRELRHPPSRVWEALTAPEHLREWAPFDADRNLDWEGAAVELTWTGTGQVTEARVTRADAPHMLEFGDLRWELEPLGKGTRITLWHNIDRRFIAWGAAGWHISFDVLDRLLNGAPIGRIAGRDAMQFGWQRLVAEYSQQFGIAKADGTKTTENS
ncbi:MAG: SRPBCC domain-containing protein [Acidobacteriaceae bacterium]|jgi:Activator of Hsp90 ATPase homolog 1-like protein